MSGKNRKTGAALLLALICGMSLWGGLAGAENTTVMLPDGRHSIQIPAEMEYQAPAEEESDLRGIFLMPPELEMLVFAYEQPGLTIQELAETLTNAGRIAETRDIGGKEFLVFQDTDEADGTSCVGHGYLEGNQMVEVTFFYATQAAMDLTRTIMESFH